MKKKLPNKMIRRFIIIEMLKALNVISRDYDYGFAMPINDENSMEQMIELSDNYIKEIEKLKGD